MARILNLHHYTDITSLSSALRHLFGVETLPDPQYSGFGSIKTSILLSPRPGRPLRGLKMLSNRKKWKLTTFSVLSNQKNCKFDNIAGPVFAFSPPRATSQRAENVVKSRKMKNDNIFSVVKSKKLQIWQHRGASFSFSPRSGAPPRCGIDSKQAKNENLLSIRWLQIAEIPDLQSKWGPEARCHLPSDTFSEWKCCRIRNIPDLAALSPLFCLLRAPRDLSEGWKYCQILKNEKRQHFQCCQIKEIANLTTLHSPAFLYRSISREIKTVSRWPVV